MSSTQGTEPYPVENPDASVGQLVGQLTADFGELVSTHIELAKVELKEDMKNVGRGAGLLSGGALTAYLALTLLSFAAAWGLAEVIPEGFAFLIVGVVWAIVAAVLAMTGRRELETVEGPKNTVGELKEDQRWLKQTI